MIRAIIIALMLTAACGDNLPSGIVTWGEVSQEVARTYCQGMADCSFEVDVDLCTEHGAWHLCVPDGTCGAEVDGDAAAVSLDECQSAVDRGAVDFADGTDASVCVGILFGILPIECAEIWELDPALL